MRQPREPGFYWVRYPDEDSEPTVGEWRGEFWVVLGYEDDWIQTVRVVSERLEPPK